MNEIENTSENNALVSKEQGQKIFQSSNEIYILILKKIKDMVEKEEVSQSESSSYLFEISCTTFILGIVSLFENPFDGINDAFMRTKEIMELNKESIFKAVKERDLARNAVNNVSETKS